MKEQTLPRGSGKSRLMDFISSFGMVIMTVILIAVFARYNPRYFSVGNLKNLIEQNAALAIIAVGVTLEIISGSMDLSSGSVLALTSICVGVVFTATGSLLLGFLAGLLLAVLIGTVNGLIISKLGLNPVIVTLSAMIWAQGLALAFSNAKSIVIAHPSVSFVNSWSAGFLSVPLLVIVLMYCLGGFLLKNTRFGRYTYAIGGGELQAKQAGISIGRYKTMVFAFAGLCVGVAALLSVSRLGSANPIMGNGLELDAIVAVVIGGNKLTGGEGSYAKTLKGVLFLAVLGNGLNTVGLPDDVYYLTKGVIILLALTIEVSSAALKKREILSLTAP